MGKRANCGLGLLGCVAKAAFRHEVPAFEVFADRQPVEWGLTEVIEHSLVSQDDPVDPGRHRMAYVITAWLHGSVCLLFC